MENTIKKIEDLISKNSNTEDTLLEICKTLNKEVEHYNWVGFYFRNGDKEELILGPYVGAETEHTKIPFGKGICGQVALSNETFVVQDVSEQDNYIACSLDVKSEIVVPIFKNGKNIGQIDIDSHHDHPFTEEDSILLEKVCEIVSTIL